MIVTVPKNTKVAKFIVLTTKQASYIHPLNLEHVIEHPNHSIHALHSADPTVRIKPEGWESFCLRLQKCANIQQN